MPGCETACFITCVTMMTISASEKARVRRYMEGVSFEEFQNLMLLQMADARAHVLHPMVVERIAICSMMAGKEGERIYRSC